MAYKSKTTAIAYKTGQQSKLVVQNAFEIKEKLKEKSYQYDRVNKEWYRLYDLNYPDHRNWMKHEIEFLNSINVQIDDSCNKMLTF